LKRAGGLSPGGGRKSWPGTLRSSPWLRCRATGSSGTNVSGLTVGPTGTFEGRTVSLTASSRPGLSLGSCLLLGLCLLAGCTGGSTAPSTSSSSAVPASVSSPSSSAVAGRGHGDRGARGGAGFADAVHRRGLLARGAGAVVATLPSLSDVVDGSPVEVAGPPFEIRFTCGATRSGATASRLDERRHLHVAAGHFGPVPGVERTGFDRTPRSSRAPSPVRWSCASRRRSGRGGALRPILPAHHLSTRFWGRAPTSGGGPFRSHCASRGCRSP